MLYCPARIIFKEHALLSAESYLSSLGSKALIVCGRNSGRVSGALEELTSTLNKLNIGYQLFDKIGENPGLEEVITGRDVFLEHGCDLLIGLGGGSPIDAAKAISLAAANGLAMNELYDLSKFHKAFPLVAIPTTAGTGSEVTQYSVLTNHQTKTKAGFGHLLAFPRLAILDPRYTLSLPDKVTLNTALDALSHLLEGLYSNQREPLMYPMIFKGIGMISQHLLHILDHPSDLASRKALMQASLYGGMTIAQSSTTLQHSIGYPLTTEYNVEHGLANALVMEQIMEMYYPVVQKELDALFATLRISRNDFICWLNKLPFPKRITITDEFIANAIPQIMASRNMALNPRTVTADEIRAVLEAIRE